MSSSPQPIRSSFARVGRNLKQAAASAESYLEMSGFSRQGLIDQLVFEGFTQQQAEYGVSEVGL